MTKDEEIKALREHIEILDDTLAVTMNMIHDVELTNMCKSKMITLLSSVMFSEPTSEQYQSREMVIRFKNKNESLERYYKRRIEGYYDK